MGLNNRQKWRSVVRLVFVPYCCHHLILLCLNRCIAAKSREVTHPSTNQIRLEVGCRLRPDRSLAGAKTAHDRECEDGRDHIRYLKTTTSITFFSCIPLNDSTVLVLWVETYREQLCDLMLILLIRIANFHHCDELHGRWAGRH